MALLTLNKPIIQSYYFFIFLERMLANPINPVPNKSMTTGSGTGGMDGIAFSAVEVKITNNVIKFSISNFFFIFFPVSNFQLIDVTIKHSYLGKRYNSQKS